MLVVKCQATLGSESDRHFRDDVHRLRLVYSVDLVGQLRQSRLVCGRVHCRCWSLVQAAPWLARRRPDACAIISLTES